MYQLLVPSGMESKMFTHLPSWSVFVDEDRYLGEEWLGHWMAHELGHLLSLEDALGATCGRSAKDQCSDCGTVLCATHTDRGKLCAAIFCQSCLSVHQQEHRKPARRDVHASENRKRA